MHSSLPHSDLPIPFSLGVGRTLQPRLLIVTTLTDALVYCRTAPRAHARLNNRRSFTPNSQPAPLLRLSAHDARARCWPRRRRLVRRRPEPCSTEPRGAI